MFWFTSDTHFGHTNILKYCKRPFASIEEMDRVLIENINTKVKTNDTLYHLGDFAKYNVAEYRRRIKCKNIILIHGNHDRPSQFGSLFKLHTPYFEHKDVYKNEKILIVLCHYAMKVWNKSHYGSYMCYGHSHGGLSDDPHARSIDVGVDCHNYSPISLDQLMDIMSKKNWIDPRIKWKEEGALWRPYDHHQPPDFHAIDMS